MTMKIQRQILHKLAHQNAVTMALVNLTIHHEVLCQGSARVSRCVDVKEVGLWNTIG